VVEARRESSDESARRVNELPAEVFERYADGETGPAVAGALGLKR
jgi:hypothetical protein